MLEVMSLHSLSWVMFYVGSYDSYVLAFIELGDVLCWKLWQLCPCIRWAVGSYDSYVLAFAELGDVLCWKLWQLYPCINSYPPPLPQVNSVFLAIDFKQLAELYILASIPFLLAGSGRWLSVWVQCHHRILGLWCFPRPQAVSCECLGAGAGQDVAGLGTGPRWCN